ncbi:MAG: hypothetical protein HQL27_08785 [Candidatus Omnitrophica bacterium]|nr:hypothetical protein [Candidatus Omnitrophota bacterium]
MRAFLLIIFILLIIFNCLACVVTQAIAKPTQKDEVQFYFEKGFMPNHYKLRIVNRDKNRAFEFSGNSENYYVITKNEAKINLDARGVGMKGVYWVNPNQEGSIPFIIERPIMNKAKDIIFRGVSYIPKMEGSYLHQTDMREIVLTYSVDNKNFGIEMGKEVIAQASFSDIFEKKSDVENVEDFDQFRLRSKSKELFKY